MYFKSKYNLIKTVNKRGIYCPILNIDIQSNSVITNSQGPTKFVRYNRAFYVVKWLFETEFFVRYNQVFVITEFHCISPITSKLFRKYKNPRITQAFSAIRCIFK